VFETLRVVDSTLVRIYTSDNPVAPQTDTVIDRMPGLTPLTHTTTSGEGSGAVRFTRAGAKGWWRLVNGDSMMINATFAGPVYNAASFDILVRASDLHEGVELTLDGFRLGANVVLPMRGRVAATDTVDGQPCWVFKGVNGMMPVTFWIDQQSHRLRRRVLQVGTGFVHLLAKPPVEGPKISDDEKVGLVLNGRFVSHRSLGFMFPRPDTGFVLDTILQRTFNASVGDPHAFGWVVRSPAPGLNVILTIIKDSSVGSEAMARHVLTGLKSPILRRGWTVIEDTARWTTEDPEIRFAAHGSNGAWLRVRCIPTPQRVTPGVLVCAQTWARYSDTIDYVSDELHFPTPGANDYESIKGRFRVWLPGPPQISQILTRDTEHLRLTRFKVVDSTTTFFVRYVDYADSVTRRKDPERVVEEERDWFVHAVNGQLADERTVSCGSYPGDVFQVDNADGSYRVKVCFAPPRMYLLYAASTEPMSLVRVALFLDSFRITGTPP